MTVDNINKEKGKKSYGGITQIGNKVKEELASVTGLEPSTVLGMESDGDGWRVTVEMLEKKSIPDSMDILGTYEVHLDNDGRMLNFNRISLRKRGDTTA